ncbi:MAG TPA: VanZ family protein [Burkholderiaceae bacterium]|nr:VanZ family protein [Burkholderiaceae bacterium]
MSTASTPEAPTVPNIRRGSPSARAGLFFYLVLVVYASWYPFSGWENRGLSPQALLLAPLPHYWTLFDIVTNVLAYLPFGLLLVFALYPRVRGFKAALLAIVAGSLLSATMEAGQTLLPSRVPSNLDLLTNALGTCIGAAAGVLLTRPFLEQSRLLALRRRWFGGDAGRGLIVLALWPLAQIYPQGYLFGHGQLTTVLSDWLSDWLATPIDLAKLLRHGALPSVEQYWLAETIITACGMAGAVLALLFLLRKQAPKGTLALALVFAAVTVKSLASALLFAPENAFAWLTPGAGGGLLVGALMLAGLTAAPPLAQRRLAVATLVTSLVIVNLVPSNPYFVATLQAWVQGKFLNFNGAAQFLSLLWPFFMLWFLLHPAHRRKRPPA